MIRNRQALEATQSHRVALDCIEAGISRALPEQVVAETITVTGSELRVTDTTYDLDAYDDVLVVGGGNAAGQLAAALEERLADQIDGGVIVTDAPADTHRIDMVEGSHPIPDETARRGTHRLLDLAQTANESTLVLALVTGGGSALLPAPAGDITLSALQTVTDSLLRSGATIDEINAVRKHLSAVKGGQLARAAAPARVVGLVMSDVVGNQLDTVASGPVVPDTSTFDRALAVCNEYSLALPTSVRDRLESGAAEDIQETPAQDDPVFDRVSVHLIADGTTALAAAADTASKHGFDPLVLSSRVRGEAREAAKTHVAIAEEIAATGTPLDPPAAVISGGETTVTVSGDGQGGPNQEFALSGALECSTAQTTLCAVDTDGLDGATDVTGAIVTGETATPAADARAALRANDVHPFLADRDALIDTGPTGTNVNDLRILVIES